MNTATQTWLTGLNDLLKHGAEISPRGQPTLELPQRTFTIDMKHPVVMATERKLNYKFMAAEAYWILSGDDQVKTIAPYNKRIAEFSDDGVVFFGAYGPKIHQQLPYVVVKLLMDPDTRQAGLTIWRESPPETKDVPCTVALFWQLRANRLNCHAFMRSSDIWLGLPYDLFNFSMLSHKVCAQLNEARTNEDPVNPSNIQPGALFLTAASSHLYQRDADLARVCATVAGQLFTEAATPPLLWLSDRLLMERLKDARDNRPNSRWWEKTSCQG